MAETERFEKQSFDFLHLFLCYSVLFSSLSRFLSTYSSYFGLTFFFQHGIHFQSFLQKHISPCLKFRPTVFTVCFLYLWKIA